MPLHNVVRRLLNHVKIRLAQRTYTWEKHGIRYLFQRADSDTLIVSFSAFPGDRPAQYNYMATLADMPVNRLFILDDYGYHGQGAYYLGKDGDFFLERAVNSLIQRIVTAHAITKRIFLGSSKGGYAALYFGMKYGAECIIAGAPQYYLGDYLYFPIHHPYLAYIMGDTSAESVRELNGLLEGAIRASTSAQRVYLHYSEHDHTYASHIQHLVAALAAKPQCTLVTDVAQYETHGEVAQFFPKYLRKILATEITSGCDAHRIF